MSQFLNDPDFQGEQDFKSIIDQMFEAKQPKPVKHRVRIPDPPAQNNSEQRESMKCAIEEMELIREAFIDFQDKISETGLYPYLFPHIEDFANVCQEMLDLVEDNFDTDELTDTGIRDYQELKKIRARILTSVWNKQNDK